MSRDALVVGINTYQYLQALDSPDIDAEAIAQRLEQDGDFGTVTQRINIGQQELEQDLKRLLRPNSQQTPDTALFYFSGHGLPDEEGYDKGYLAATDTNPSYPKSGLSLRWLQWLLSESKIRQQIVWLDCCHSGGLIINMGAANPGHGESRDRCFIVSSRDFESSWTDLNSCYSVLTRALLDGL